MAPDCGCRAAGWLRTETGSTLQPETTRTMARSLGANPPGTPSWGAGDYSNSILQWGPGFFRGAYVPPDFRKTLDRWDSDLGSSRVIVVPGTNYIIAGSKWGDLFILDRSGVMSSNSLVQRVSQLCIGGRALYNGFAFWNNTVYTWCTNDYLKA